MGEIPVPEYLGAILSEPLQLFRIILLPSQLEETRADPPWKAEAALRRVAEFRSLSPDVRDIVDRSLA